MNKKKKILLSLTAITAAIALIVTGASAFFIEYDTTHDVAKTGSVFLDVSPITVGHNAVYKQGSTTETVNSSDSVSGIRKQLTSMNLQTLSYAYGSGPCEYWIYKDSGFLLNDVYFRAKLKSDNTSYTTYPYVAYCVDSGKLATDAKFTDTGMSTNYKGTTELKETTIVSDDVKAVLQVGYPNKSYKDYELAYNDIEFEWATSVAINIAEGDAYHTSGEYWEDHIIRLDRMSVDGINGEQVLVPLSVYSPNSFANEEAKNANEAEAARLKQLVSDILDQAEKLNSVPAFYLDYTNAINENQYAEVYENGKVVDYKLKGYKVGPFRLDNTIGTASLKAYINGAQAPEDIVFWDSLGNVITSLDATFDDPFYLYVPSKYKYSDISIKVECDKEKEYPMYYYWDGNPTHQKMVYCEKIKPSEEVLISKAMYDDYTYWNPGDVLTLKWTVKNTGTKSVVTRNIVSIYWENNNMSNYANNKDIVYLYPENTSATSIFWDQFPTTANDYRKEITKYKTTCMNTCSYKQMGSMGTVYVNGKEYKAGYSFIVYGDALDGVGEGAEVGNAKEQNYSSVYDETLNNIDEVAFKMALSSAANNYTQGQKLVIRVETQAMQYRNTSDKDWDTLFKDSYCYYGNDRHDSETGVVDHTNVPGKVQYNNGNTDKIADWDSQWQTIATNEYVIGSGQLLPNDPLN